MIVRVNPAGASYSRFPANARVPLPRIAGHRDGDATDCPGNVLYGELPAIRRAVQRLAPNPARATLALAAPAAVPTPAAPEPTPGASGPSPGPPAAPPAPGAPATQLLSGVLALIDGTPVRDAPIVIQARSVSRKGEVVNELTLAESRTDSAGMWSLNATPLASASGGMWLRALCPGAAGVGACVSAPLHVPVTLSLAAAPA